MYTFLTRCVAAITVIGPLASPTFAQTPDARAGAVIVETRPVRRTTPEPIALPQPIIVVGGHGPRGAAAAPQPGTPKPTIAAPKPTAPPRAAGDL